MASLEHTALVQTFQLIWYLSNAAQWDDFSASTRSDAVEHALTMLSEAAAGQSDAVKAAVAEACSSFEGHPMAPLAGDFFQQVERIVKAEAPADLIQSLVK